MAKCILLVRVSTESKKQKESIKEQEKELFDLAIADGYTESDIIPICTQESGLKRFYAKTEDEKNEIEIKRQGLQEMENLIKNDSGINCVYAWEISRISRREKVLYNELEFLTDRKIQLIIKSPYIKLLLPNGDIDINAKMAFSIFATLAASEMTNKLARFKRSKENKRAEGKFVGGFIPFGYTVDKDSKKFIVNEEEAEIIKFIFNEYLNGKFSVYGLADELQARGIINYNNRKSAKTFVSIVLHNYAYAGLPVTNRLKRAKSSGNIYPAIVTKEMVDAAILKAEAAISKPKTATKNIYYAKGLIKCSECGCNYVSRKASAIYHCGNEINKCTNPSISINLIDSLLWYVAINLKSWKMLHQSEDDKLEYQNQIEINIQKINKIEQDLKDNEDAYGIIYELVKRKRITLDKYENDAKELDKEKEKLHLQKNELINKNFEIERLLQNINSSVSVDIDAIADIEDDTTRYDIIHEVIDKLLVYKVASGVLRIEIYQKLLDTPMIYYITTRNRKIYNSNFDIAQAYQFIDEHIINITILERYKRKNDENDKERHKEYYKKNRDKIIKKSVERKRLYRANNRDEYNQKEREHRAKKKMEQNKGEG